MGQNANPIKYRFLGIAKLTPSTYLCGRKLYECSLPQEVIY